MIPDRAASIDIGSNSVILLVAERDETLQWRSRYDRAQITRISEGLDASGVLAEGPIERTLDIVQNYLTEARENHDVEEILITGTAPFRRATNGSEVADRFTGALGVPLRVVSGEEEAALSLLATRRSFPDLDPLLIVDIGGASTEFVLSSDGGEPRLLSLDIGSVRLTERHISSDPIEPDERQALQNAIDEALAPPSFLDEARPARLPLIGIAGTVTTLAAMAAGLVDYDAGRIHRSELHPEDLDTMVDRLFALTTAERAALPGIEPARADVIAAGALLLARIVGRTESPLLLVSDRGLRWGRLHEEFDRIEPNRP